MASDPRSLLSLFSRLWESVLVRNELSQRERSAPQQLRIRECPSHPREADPAGQEGAAGSPGIKVPSTRIWEGKWSQRAMGSWDGKPRAGIRGRLHQQPQLVLLCCQVANPTQGQRPQQRLLPPLTSVPAGPSCSWHTPPATPAPDLQLQLQDLRSLQQPSPMGYLTTHPLPPPREPREAARTSQKNPFLSPPCGQRCSPPAQDEVWRVQKKGAGPKYSWRGQRFIFHPFPRQQALHSPCLLPVSPLPHLLLAPALAVFAERPRELGQVCSPELCARGLWSHHGAQQHQTLSPARRGPGCATPTPWTALLSPRLLLEELAAAPAEHEAVGQQSCPAGCHEPGLAAAVAERGSLCPR